MDHPEIKEERRMQERIENLTNKITAKFSRVEEFNNGSYFKYTRLSDNSDIISPERKSIAKLKGRYTVKVNKDLPESTRIQMVANDQMIYYMHKTNKVFSKMKEKPTVKEI